jgi:hypothetical protein
MTKVNSDTYDLINTMEKAMNMLHRMCSIACNDMVENGWYKDKSEAWEAIRQRAVK